MTEKQKDDFSYIWDARWKGSDQKERISFLARLMLKAKAKAILSAVRDMHVDSVLEVGCGLGYTLKVFLNAGYKCLGIDASEQAVKVCKNKGLPVRFQRLAEVTDKHDLVSSDGMLEHFLNFEPYAVDLMRISRRYVLLIQPNHGSIVGKSFVFLAELLRGESNVFEYNYRIQDFIDVFEKNRFRNVKNCPVFFDVFRLLIFEREMV